MFFSNIYLTGYTSKLEYRVEQAAKIHMVSVLTFVI